MIAVSWIVLICTSLWGKICPLQTKGLCDGAQTINILESLEFLGFGFLSWDLKNDAVSLNKTKETGLLCKLYWSIDILLNNMHIFFFSCLESKTN